MRELHPTITLVSQASAPLKIQWTLPQNHVSARNAAGAFLGHSLARLFSWAPTSVRWGEESRTTPGSVGLSVLGSGGAKPILWRAGPPQGRGRRISPQTARRDNEET